MKNWQRDGWMGRIPLQTGGLARQTGRWMDKWGDKWMNAWVFGIRMSLQLHTPSEEGERGGWGTAGRVMVGREWGALASEVMVCSSSAHEMKPHLKTKMSYLGSFIPLLCRNSAMDTVLLWTYTQEFANYAEGFSLVMKEICLAPTRRLKGSITCYLCYLKHVFSVLKKHFF